MKNYCMHVHVFRARVHAAEALQKNTEKYLLTISQQRIKD